MLSFKFPLQIICLKKIKVDIIWGLQDYRKTEDNLLVRLSILKKFNLRLKNSFYYSFKK